MSIQRVRIEQMRIDPKLFAMIRERISACDAYLAPKGDVYAEIRVGDGEAKLTQKDREVTLIGEKYDALTETIFRFYKDNEEKTRELSKILEKTTYPPLP